MDIKDQRCRPSLISLLLKCLIRWQKGKNSILMQKVYYNSLKEYLDTLFLKHYSWERRRMLDHNQNYSAAHKWTLSACCDIAINVGLCLSNVDSFHTNKTGCSTNTRSVGSSPWRSSQNLFQYTWLFWRKCWSVISALEFRDWKCPSSSPTPLPFLLLLLDLLLDQIGCTFNPPLNVENIYMI